ncbi:EAL domain-containing protein [Bradyrhizobium tropiciagri]|uniref:bifunctional diguanylate cyclase/phosphodiesterase n=1 Tax=Bradyrhizobium tropiciagri TaxID=312253 RepID=UPI001BAC37E8|nr:bifunctional diguanylate cyclase/phosphodiesterase [Bradyrhizobium tropiciagri]MBR0894391.1 EAL domain-containing protein [Bradyrhizobium tropiciagri]
MFKVYNCIATEHDLWLVGLAAVVCSLASYAAINLLRHARSSVGQMRGVWLVVSAVSTGFGIWATHFIAMLAFAPGIPSGYNIKLTFLSLVAAIVLTGVGLAVAMRPSWRFGPALGGAIVAGGIAAMHYTGMAAFEIAGIILWDRTLVAASIVIGAVIGAAALPAGLHDRSEKWKAVGALLLTLAICSHHFTAMGAVSIIPDPTIHVSRSALPAEWLAGAVGVASFVIILLALTGSALDLRERRRMEIEADRMRGLANGAVEGLLVCDGDLIVTVNDSFVHLAGAASEQLVGCRLATCFPDRIALARIVADPHKPIETNLHHTDGSTIPVELIMRSLDFAGRPHHVIAVRDLRARREAERHIRYLAHHDALTSLPNRSHFNARMDQEVGIALAKSEKLAVLCLDLDRFKEVNDLFGHAAGDKVLQAVASRVTAVLGERHMMARLGGDEFAILVPQASPSAVSHLAEAILDALRRKDIMPEVESISSSIGIAICPDDASEREALLVHADTALYRAKTEGRSTYRFFEAKMGSDVRERRMIEHDLRHAIGRDELRLVYQPQKDIRTGAVTGFEALLRWKHPTRGDISPAVFIPIAEESGSILEIGDWVMRTACREAANWTHPLTVAVNVSGVQLYNSNFVQDVHKILLETGLSPRRLEIEITETALVRDFNRALATLRRVKGFGVRIAMDDFGTGYSSLSNLRAFPFDKIKIDGSFIKSVDTNEQAATIVRAVLGIGRGLGLPVLAEGVESNEELQFLRDELCDEMQGYLLGAPARIETFRGLTHRGDVAPAADQDSAPALARIA